MMSFSPKRVVSACLAAFLLVSLLSACTFTLPSIGGVKGLATVAPEANGTPSADETGGEASPSKSPEADAPVEPDLSPAEELLITEDFNDPENPPHGFILFTSAAEHPFQKMDAAPAWSEVISGAAAATTGPAAERYLWAVSVDGSRAGRVSPDGLGSAMFVSDKQSKIITNGFLLPGAQLEAVPLPAECAESGGCGGYQFSPTGSLLAYFSGPEETCGRTLTLYDFTAQKPLNTWSGVHWAYFFQNGSLILALGDCETQMAYLYTPGTGKQGGVAKVGKAHWNPTHTAVLYQVQGDPAPQTLLWGFNLETSKVFLWPSQELVIEDSPIWLADGEHFVFQHQSFTYDKNTKSAMLNSPRQVVLMNAKTRSQRQLAFDPRSSYHLCGASDLPDAEAVGSPCSQNYDNWLRVLRLPYNPQRFPVEEQNKPAVRCAMYGLNCTESPETLALDWKTGKEYPWEEARVPDATATPQAHQPDLNQPPFYEDPAGEYAFYIGQGGKTLWYVPRDREPALWVQNGENFFYLP